MAKHRGSPSKFTSLFDVRLSNLEHDVLVLKGSEHDASSALVLGKIVLLLKEPLNIKALSLRLFSTIRLNWIDTYNTANGASICRPLRFDKQIYEYVWDNVDISHHFNNLYDIAASGSNVISSGTLGAHTMPHGSLSVSLKSLGNAMRGKSCTNITNMHLSSLSIHHLSTSLATPGSGGSSAHVLMLGNYLFPFTAVLPGSMPESVEGLPGGSHVYRLEAIIDRGKFHGSILTRKHIRVIRTMMSDAVELSELISIDNTWPEKVEYSLNVPAKAIAIGSGTPINCLFIPLSKGLRLGTITIQLHEVYSYAGYMPPVHSGDRLIVERVIPAVPENKEQHNMDRWEVNTFLRIPTTLSRVAQDCDILQHIKVRHKIKFNICLINPDGRVSELRASLPVQLFISPFIAVSGKVDEQLYNSNNDIGGPLASEIVPEGCVNDSQEEPIFDAINIGESSTNLVNTLEPISNSSYASLPGLMAPPLYERHVHDRLWSDLSPMDSPIHSVSIFPNGSSYANNSNDEGFFGLISVSRADCNGIDARLLDENLHRLCMQDLSHPPRQDGHRATFNLDSSPNSNSDCDESSNVATANRLLSSVSRGLSAQATYLHTPQLMTPPTHLSRANSEFHLNSLTLIPSYTQAMRSGTNDEPLAPAYNPPLPGSSVNLEDVNRRFEELTVIARSQDFHKV